MSLAEIHRLLSTAVVIYTIILGVWGIYNFVRRREVSAGFWGALVAGELLILSQGSLGSILWYQGYRPAHGTHVLYGAATAWGIPAIYVLTRGREGHAENLAYGCAALIVALLTWQAIVTSH